MPDSATLFALLGLAVAALSLADLALGGARRRPPFMLEEADPDA